MQKKILSTLFIATLSIFGGLFLLNNPVNAEDLPDTFISMSPVSDKIEVTPGETYTGTFNVSNIGGKSFNYILETKPFSVSDENYENDFDTKNIYNDVTNWVTFDREGGSLEPNTTDRIAYTINVPENATPGGQYAAIAATTISEAYGSNGSVFNVSKSVAMIIYLTISGEVNRSGEIIENNIPSFYFEGPISAGSLVSNTGNIHNEAEYILEINNFFTGELAYSNSEKPETHLILPDTKRYSEIKWDNAPMLGVFKVKQTINYLGESSVVEKIVIICPLWLIFIIIFLLVLMIIWIITRSRARSRKKAEAE